MRAPVDGRVKRNRKWQLLLLLLIDEEEERQQQWRIGSKHLHISNGSSYMHAVARGYKTTTASYKHYTQTSTFLKVAGYGERTSQPQH